MEKIVSFLLIFVLLLSLVGCSDKPNVSNTVYPNNDVHTDNKQIAVSNTLTTENETFSETVGNINSDKCPAHLSSVASTKNDTSNGKDNSFLLNSQNQTGASDINNPPSASKITDDFTQDKLYEITNGDTNKISSYIFQFINDVRQTDGNPQLIKDSNLEKAAKTRSVELHTLFSNKRPDNKGDFNTAVKNESQYRALSECIGDVVYDQPVTGSTEQMREIANLLYSKITDNKNYKRILNSYTFTQIGIGVSYEIDTTASTITFCVSVIAACN